MTWKATRCQGRHHSRWIMKRFEWAKGKISVLSFLPLFLLPSNAIMTRSTTPGMLTAPLNMAGWGAGRCAYYHRMLISLCCLSLSSEECQVALSSVHLITSPVAPSLLDGCRDSLVTKVRAHLKEVPSSNEDSPCVACPYPNTVPQQSSIHPNLSPPTIPQIYSPKGSRQREQRYEPWWPSASKWQRHGGNDSSSRIPRDHSTRVSQRRNPRPSSSMWFAKGWAARPAWERSADSGGHHTVPPTAPESPDLTSIICEIQAWTKWPLQYSPALTFSNVAVPGVPLAQRHLCLYTASPIACEEGSVVVPTQQYLQVIWVFMISPGDSYAH